MKHKTIHIKKATITRLINTQDFEWLLVTNRGHIVKTIISQIEDFDILVFPLVLIYNNSEIEIIIPDNLASHPLVRTYFALINQNRGNQALIARSIYSRFLKVIGKEETDKLLDQWKELYEILLDKLENNPDQLKDIRSMEDLIKIPDYAYHRLKTLRSTPQRKLWQEEKGQKNILTFEGIPGQKTRFDISKGGPYHLTPLQKKMFFVLYNLSAKDGERGSRRGYVTYSELCTLLKMPVSGKQYDIIDAAILSLQQQEIIRPMKTHDLHFRFLNWAAIPKKNIVFDQGRIEQTRASNYFTYEIGPIELKNEVNFDLRLTEGLTYGQDNIIQELISQRIKMIPKLGGLPYHVHSENTHNFLLRNGYIPKQRRGTRHIKRFYEELNELKILRKEYPGHSQQPGFTYEERGDIKGGMDLRATKNRTITLYHYATRNIEKQLSLLENIQGGGL